MSATAKMRRRSPDATVWRESTTDLRPCQGRRFYAMRAGWHLEVVQYTDRFLRGDVFKPYPHNPRFRNSKSVMTWPISRTNQRQADAQLAIAQRWAEMRADELAENARKSTQKQGESPVNLAGVTGGSEAV